MANTPAPRVERWADRTRQEFISLLGAGEQLVTVADALEFFGLLSRFLPEWRVVRSRPQRNAFHIYTVDRHLLRTVVESCPTKFLLANPAMDRQQYADLFQLNPTELDLVSHLVPLAEGKYIGAFALTEVLAGSDSFNLRTRAKRDGDEWVINGEKMWITNGGIADVVSLFARTDKGITGFVVETKTPGYHAGPPEKKMGIRGSQTTPITFENVRVPKENLLGGEGRGLGVGQQAAVVPDA